VTLDPRVEESDPLAEVSYAGCIVAGLLPAGADSARRSITVYEPKGIKCLVANLVDNAQRYNLGHGPVDILTATKAGAAVLSVSNGGPILPASAVDRLPQPFQRIGAERTGHGEGLGLGLSVVEAVAASHGGTLTFYPPTDCGLKATVSLPARNLVAVNCFVVCGGTPCPTIFQPEFVQERCRSARSKEVSPILFVHSRVLTPSRWSL